MIRTLSRVKFFINSTIFCHLKFYLLILFNICFHIRKNFFFQKSGENSKNENLTLGLEKVSDELLEDLENDYEKSVDELTKKKRKS